MKLLFEEHRYRTEDVQGILGGFVLSGLDLTKAEQQLRYVGYFFNKDIEHSDGRKGDMVFILPKVLLDADGKVFGLSPEQIIDFNYSEWKNDELVVSEGKLSKRQVYDFIYGFTTWIYRAVDIYRKNLRNKPSDENYADVMTSLQIGQSSKKTDATFMDVILSLIDFERRHKGFITYTIKMAHSGFNKISWPRTIARTQAVVQNGSPVYLNPINKKRVVDFDEELLIIYYSILDYIHTEYGFPTPNQPGYKLIKGAMFRSYLKNQGKTRLHKIRYKYYSDQAILLWNLCYAFFDKADNIKAQTNRKDFLLVSKFETVFEAMIDELLGDKNLPDGLKVSGDDKRIDHLYTYKYLLENMDDTLEQSASNEIYHIADSKYYKRSRGLSGHDVPKQFTYVRNVIQWHMDLLHDLLNKDMDKAEKFKSIRLFDPLTEGYNIIPNFFISAQVDEDLNYDRSNFSQSILRDGNAVYESYIFWDRLFDRNTYFTLHYDVNFLFVLKKYAQNKSYDKAVWKEGIRKKFRNHTLSHLNEEFSFRQIMVPEAEMEDFVDRHYRKIIGKVFSFEDMQGHNVLLYAERRTQSDGKGKCYSYDSANDAHIKDGCLVIPGKAATEFYRALPIDLAKDSYRDTAELQIEYALVGYYKDQNHYDWITKNGLYNIRTLLEGKEVRLTEANLNATHLILHNDKLGNHIFRITGDSIKRIKKENLPKGSYIPSHDEYLIYVIDPVPITDKYITDLVNSKKFEEKLKKKSPITVNMDNLKEQYDIIKFSNFSSYIQKDEIFNSMVAEDQVTYENYE